MLKKVILLSIAIGLTIIAVFIQQFTSNNRPVKEYTNINGKVYNIKLPVFYEGKEGCLIEINIPDSSVTGNVFYKTLNGRENWCPKRLIRMNENLISMLPNQKPNVKLQYYLELKSFKRSYYLAHSNPVIVRFQEEVPKYIIYPQVICIFLALILSCYAGLLAIFKLDTYKKYSLLAYYFMLAGALVLNLVVYVITFRTIFVKFEVYNDLTVYRNLLLYMFMLLIFNINRKNENRFFTCIISTLTLLVFCLPQNFLFYWLIRIG
jgi:hypothetical protein